MRAAGSSGTVCAGASDDSGPTAENRRPRARAHAVRLFSRGLTISQLQSSYLMGSARVLYSLGISIAKFFPHWSHWKQ